MKHATRRAAFAAALCFAASASQAEGIQWTQTINLPKGLNMPQGVSADILGLTLGDSYAEAKAKLEAMRQQAKASSRDMQEKAVHWRLPIGNTAVPVSYVGSIELRTRPRPGVQESIEVKFTAPSSGHQVVGVRRSITYSGAQNQIRIDALAESLKAKYKAEPQANALGYMLRFAGGNPLKAASMFECRPDVFSANDWGEATLRTMNAQGNCDVTLQVQVTRGQSRQHAEAVVFSLADNERLKQNGLADHAFLRSIMQNMRQNREQSGGAPGPKL